MDSTIQNPTAVEFKPVVSGLNSGTNLKESTELAKANALSQEVSQVQPESEELKLNINDALIERINQRLEDLNVGLAFSLDEATRSSIMKLIDRSTTEVVRQYPSEEALRVIQNIQAFLDSSTVVPAKDGKGLTGALLNQII
ncbi:flagellar protein FlaG [Thiomicrospira sp. ALE5]|uniref:flagellar protein FlaG n=1 Tax=Thiomicrospira sp. ALE5 TaxID=748650 RepID=UPI0008EA293C|nr:flagellar protein FlaG [Thiomicrospira sp. ALE5]SFR59343.1 flagellar protein FlaG [Thiomicrospira sp. ALE5]